jgi:gliding motility-associated-like protein
MRHRLILIMRLLFLFAFLFLFSFARAEDHHHKRAKKDTLANVTSNRFPTTDTTYRLVIYDRWGEMIYRDYGEHASWDGQSGTKGISQAGTYFYVVYRDKEKLGSGTITVIR